MLRLKLDFLLYRYRAALSALLLLIICYFVLYTWLALPPIVLFLGWQPDTEMRVLPIMIEEEYGRYVQPGDVVLAIDGQPAQRGRILFKPPVKPVYELTLQRGEAIFRQDVPIGERHIFNVWILSQSILALATWIVGCLTVQFAHRGQTQALYAGLGFQLIAAGIVSPGPSQLGAPGAWLIGHVLIVYFPFIVLYLAYLPRHLPLNAWSRRLLHGSFCLLTALAVIALAEVMYLFPHRSLESVIGLRTFGLISILAGSAILFALTFLLVRLIRAPGQSYERQQIVILFVFLTLALAPLFVFVILPLDQFLFVPFPFVYSLFLLAPGGYFFVLHRQGYLELDPVFSRLVTIVVLVVAAAMTYATGIYLVETIFSMDVSSASQGGFVLLLSALAMTSQRRVQTYVDLILYGHDPFGQESIQAARITLSANPEPATVSQVLAHIAAHLHVKQAVVLVKAEKQFQLLAGNAEAFAVPVSPVCRQLLLRTRESDSFAEFPEWVELSIPITARGDLLGLLVLSRPPNAYFNARQVQTLKDISDILAFGLLVISLVETMQWLARQALYDKEMQRQRIATEIHNETLHTLTEAILRLQSDASGETVPDAIHTIRRVVRDLRRILADLRPPVLKESVEWIARQTVREFGETHDDMRVTLLPDIRSDEQASEQTKVAFYYILTEALNNISRHAQATEVKVKLCYDDFQLVLEVRDNGIGAAAVTQSLAELLRAHHIGLADMHRWALLGRGELLLEPNVPCGTVVKLTLPTTVMETAVIAAYE
jgi:signal transduction histidine kinase